MLNASSSSACGFLSIHNKCHSMYGALIDGHECDVSALQIAPDNIQRDADIHFKHKEQNVSQKQCAGVAMTLTVDILR